MARSGSEGTTRGVSPAPKSQQQAIDGVAPMKTLEASPRAKLLITSMRNVGYSLASAMADVVDNSIAAGATQVHIYADPKAEYLAILDNGKGMSAEELREVMRPGSRGESISDPALDLGRFGLGLKSASFSQCKRLTVVTRQNGMEAAVIWDLDFVAGRNEWLLLVPDATSTLPAIDYMQATGTLVIWEALDRVDGLPGSEQRANHFAESVDEARTHLELVFHRYLSGEQGLRQVSLDLNGTPLKAYDPFHSGHRKTSSAPEERIVLGHSTVSLKAFTLPHHRAVTPEEWQYQGGAAGHLRNQGFYLYRQKRLIIHGTWFGLMRMGELTKLTRVRIDIDNTQDAEWKIDIKKSSAEFPAQVRSRLRELISTIAVPSQRIYNGRAKKLYDTQRLPVWQRSRHQEVVSYAVNQLHPAVTSLASGLPEAKTTQLRYLLELLGDVLPTDLIFADAANNPQALSSEALSDSRLSFLAVTTAVQLLEAGMRPDDIITAMQSSDPFRTRWDQLVDLVKQKVAPSDA